jgi:hypothetical protein
VRPTEIWQKRRRTFIKWMIKQTKCTWISNCLKCIGMRKMERGVRRRIREVKGIVCIKSMSKKNRVIVRNYFDSIYLIIK